MHPNFRSCTTIPRGPAPYAISRCISAGGGPLCAAGTKYARPAELFETKDTRHAIELMSKHPGIRLGPFEIRPADERLNAMGALNGTSASRKAQNAEATQKREPRSRPK